MLVTTELDERTGLDCGHRPRSRVHVSLCIVNPSHTRTKSMSAHSSQIAEVAACHDWPNRYYHVDQILNKPGPRTDPSFLAGQGVNESIAVYFHIYLLVYQR